MQQPNRRHSQMRFAWVCLTIVLLLFCAPGCLGEPSTALNATPALLTYISSPQPPLHSPTMDIPSITAEITITATPTRMTTISLAPSQTPIVAAKTPTRRPTKTFPSTETPTLTATIAPTLDIFHLQQGLYFIFGSAGFAYVRPYGQAVDDQGPYPSLRLLEKDHGLFNVSPDGKQIVFLAIKDKPVHGDRDSSLMVYDVTIGDSRLLSLPEEFVLLGNTAWSP